jgi:hypothetical protein
MFRPCVPVIRITTEVAIQPRLWPERQPIMLEEDPVLEAHRYKWRKVALGVLFLALVFVIFRALATSGN